MAERFHSPAQELSQSISVRIDSCSSPVDAACVLLDLDAATAAGIAEVAGRSDGLRLVPASRDALFSREELHGCGCVVAMTDDERGDSWSLPRRLYQHPSALRVVFLVRQPEIRAVVDASRSGADDVVAWPSEAQHLPGAIEQACRASALSADGVAQCLEARSRLSQLSPGECDVMQLMLSAVPNKNIAARLDIAMRTVEARRKEVFFKLGTRSTAHIFAMIQQADRTWPPCDPAAGRNPASPHFPTWAGRQIVALAGD